MCNINKGQLPGDLAPFEKSSYSDHGGGCVEVAKGDVIAVRDSKAPDGPVLRFARGEWLAFLATAGDGEFDIG